MIKTEKDLAMTIRAARMACPDAAVGVRDWYAERERPEDIMNDSYGGRVYFLKFHRLADMRRLGVAMPLLRTAYTMSDLWGAVDRALPPQ